MASPDAATSVRELREALSRLADDDGDFAGRV
jgi:hypothetical protein